MADLIPTFDLQRWINLFPLGSSPIERYRCHVGNSSPRNIAITEQIRRKLFPVDAPSAPTDLFAFADGEPERRDVSKWNGLPYRPADNPWPTSDGEPMTFFGQFRFVESRDFLTDLPGDILLVFVGREGSNERYLVPEDLHFEWQRLGIDELVQADEVPRPHFPFPHVHGVRHRTCDYRAWPEEAESIVGSLVEIDAEKERSIPVYALERKQALCRLDGWKIGGLPFWGFRAQEYAANENDLGRFLCSVSMHWLDYDEPHPFVNRADPIPKPESYFTDHKRNLYFADGFNLNIFLRDDGTVHPEIIYF